MTLVYKPRPKMRSWSPPSPPKPRRSRFYLWAVLGWLCVLAVGVRWFAAGGTWLQPNDASDPEPLYPSASPPATSDVQLGRFVQPSPAPSSDLEPVKPSTDAAILPCEEFLKQASDPADSRLPAYLGRSALDVFVGDNAWARPCRTKHRLAAQLCVAIRDGAVRGFTVRTSPPNLTLENCLREQAAKLVLQPESSVRVVRTMLFL
jgi:hypothetical protein